jgi:hypothetical protein
MKAKTKLKRLQHFLLSGEEAQNPENLINFFETIKGRSATPQERAQFKRKKAAAKSKGTVA